ncbi:MAG TPA: intein-containing Rv2578c family radical SAM protein [Actinomycetota bacterium]|nr:intein-containing Rv2578c family radical SAM protein [Actinomycetota bacterium]
MRWDNLRLDVRPTDDRVTVPLFEQGAVVRTFDTPEFRGITFYEVRAKSIINRVPEQSYVPFRWTINPYRGCTHSCSYCMGGDTPVLMADGRIKPIAEVRVGEEIYGTVRRGNYRRYVRTKVLAHWSTAKPAYLITLEDGTELIASEDHRFLSNRGWKHVIGSVWGPNTRPHLTTNNSLMGTGRFAAGPSDNAEYRRGYLCGMIRGDGHLGSYAYARAGRVHGDVHRFRLALVDLEALQRARNYLLDFQIPTHNFVFQQAVGAARPIHAIRNQSRAGVAAIRDVISWPHARSVDWTKGFLAGIFDAEGHYGGGILRFANTNLEILREIASALDRLGFESRLEVTGKPNGLCTVRLLGGICEALRFFHATDPAISRKRSIEGQAIKNKARLKVVSIEPLGIDLPMYDITTGTGDFIANGVVSHNCFARKTHTYLDFDYGEDFDTRIVVKVNAPELLRRELAAPRWEGEHIAMGTNVDPYQRAEGRYRLMRGILEGLRDFANPFSILTKGTLILRDIDLLQECAAVTDVATNFSVGSVDREIWRATETGTPSQRKRLNAVRTLNAAGVPCGVLMAPILPFLSDSDEAITETVRAVAEAKATHVTPIVLHLRKGGSREWYMRWLKEAHPELIPKYRELYGDGAYAPKAYQQEIGEKVRRLARRFGVGRASARQARRVPAPPPVPQPEQLGLSI